MTRAASVRHRPTVVHLTVRESVHVSGNHLWWNATTDLLAMLPLNCPVSMHSIV